MRQMVLAYIFIQGWTIDPYKHWSFYQPGEVLLLPTHYAKIFKWGSMTCGVAVVIYGGGGLQMLLVSLSKCFWCFTNALLITFQPITFESVNHTTLFGYVVFIFWCHQFIFQVLPLLKCTCMPYFCQYFWSFHLVPCCMELWWNFCWCSCFCCFGCCFFVFVEYCFLTSSFWWPMVDICRLIRLYLCVLILLLIVLGLSRCS